MLNDVRYGLRALRRNAAVTVTAIVALGLGISANTAMFSLADAFLFKPLALKDPDRLVSPAGDSRRRADRRHLPCCARELRRLEEADNVV